MKRFSVFQIILFLFGAVLLCNGIHVLMVTNFNLGSLLVLGLGAACLLYGALFRRLRRQRWLHVLAAVCCLVLTVCVGAVAFAGTNDNPTSAAMERYLLSRGVPAEKILKEEHATSTLENFKNTIPLLEERFPDGYTLTVITSRFHVFRAVRIARHTGLLVTHVGAGIRWYTIPMNYLRELVAIANEVRRGSIRL